MKRASLIVHGRDNTDRLLDGSVKVVMIAGGESLALYLTGEQVYELILSLVNEQFLSSRGPGGASALRGPAGGVGNVADFQQQIRNGATGILAVAREHGRV